MSAPPLGAGLADLRVLLLDDSATSREVLRRQTTAWGLVNDAAENGPQGLALLQGAVRAGGP